jgi:hypothetical protein
MSVLPDTVFLMEVPRSRPEFARDRGSITHDDDENGGLVTELRRRGEPVVCSRVEVLRSALRGRCAVSTTGRRERR